MQNNPETNELEDDLFEHFKVEVPKGQALLRIDKFLMGFIQNATRNKIQNAATNGDIYVNDVPVKSNYKEKVKKNHQVVLTLQHKTVILVMT
jgi:23S rRNA pseudouridine1911/1915/1917 synthase